MKFMIVFSNGINGPWAGMANTVLGGLLSIMTDFVVPVIAGLLAIYAFMQFPALVMSYREGDGTFNKKLLITIMIFVVVGILGTIWGMFATYFNT